MVADSLEVESLAHLTGINNQKAALAGSQRPGHLIAEVHMAWRVNQIQRVGLPVRGNILHPSLVQLDRDPSLSFQVHAVQELGLTSITSLCYLFDKSHHQHARTIIHAEGI